MAIHTMISSFADVLNKMYGDIRSNTNTPGRPHAREAIYVHSNNSYFDVPIPKSTTIGCSFGHQGYYRVGGTPLEFFDTDFSTTQPVYRVNVGSFEAWDGAAWVTLSSTLAPVTGAARYDFFLTIGDGGMFRSYIDQTLAGTFDGDTLLAGITGIDLIRFRSWGHSSYYSIYSGIIVADEDTRDMVFVSSLPTSAGDISEWPQGSYTDIDDIEYSNSDFMGSTAADQTATFAKHALPTGYETYNIAAVSVNAAARKSMSGPGGLNVGLRIGTTNHLSPDVALTRDDATIIQRFDVNPETGAAWTQADLNAAQLAVKSRP